MSQFVEVKTAELTGPALDWAVAQVEGVACTPHTIERFYRPSTDWVQGGPLLSEMKVDLTHGESTIYATICTEDCEYKEGRGPTELIAICRAIVAAKLGDTVRVPPELVGVRP